MESRAVDDPPDLRSDRRYRAHAAKLQGYVACRSAELAAFGWPPGLPDALNLCVLRDRVLVRGDVIALGGDDPSFHDNHVADRRQGRSAPSSVAVRSGARTKFMSSSTVIFVRSSTWKG
jgi:hypothetical protein